MKFYVSLHKRCEFHRKNDRVFPFQKENKSTL